MRKFSPFIAVIAPAAILTLLDDSRAFSGHTSTEGTGAAILSAGRCRRLTSIRRLKRSVGAATAVLVVLFALSGVSSAQGFDLSQLLGGGAGLARHSSPSSAAGVTVERGAAPYTGTFTGKQTTSSGTDSVTTHFACYPAQDPNFAQTKTYLCYAGE